MSTSTATPPAEARDRPVGSTTRDVSSLASTLAAPAALVVVGIAFAILSPRFLTPTNLLTIMSEAAVVGILALGVTVVLVVGGIDLSVGSMVSLTSVLLSIALREVGLPIELAIIVAIVAGGLLGAFNGLLVVVTGVPTIIVTLGTLSIFRALAQFASGSQTTDLVGYGLLNFLGVGRIEDVPVPGILMILLIMVAQAFFAWSAPFRRLRAIGANSQASILMGLPASRYVVGAFVISGMLAGIAGIVISGRLSSASPNAGFGLELAAITAAVLGGTALTGGSGSAIGSLIGALLLATVFNGLVLMGFSAFAQQVATGVILAIAVAVNMAIRRRSG